MQKRCLVTGGAGFIGSHLVERLLADGHEVVAVDNLATGQRTNLPREASRLTFQEADVADAGSLSSLFEKIDWVFHLAALADIVPSIQEPHRYYDVNVTGTFNVVNACQNAGVQRFVYAASSSCYGIPEEYPTAESTPIRPQYPYALTKYMGEEIVSHWASVYGLPAVSLRLFNVYGPRSRTTGAYGAVFGVFLAQKLAGKPFTVVGDGEQTRDFTFVTDVVDAFVKSAESDLSGEVMNVGSSGHYSVNRLCELLGGSITHIPKRPGEPDCTFADTTRIKAKLGWQPQVTFEQGVDTMLRNVECWRDAPVWDADSIHEETRDWFKFLG